MSTILFLVNHEIVIYNFRLEIIEKLLDEGHRVIVSSPGGERIEKLKAMGCEHRNIEFSRHGINPFKEIKLISIYRKLIKEEKPDIIFTFTIKPNIYGSIAARKYRVPCVSNITGLGIAVEHKGNCTRYCQYTYILFQEKQMIPPKYVYYIILFMVCLL